MASSNALLKLATTYHYTNDKTRKKKKGERKKKERKKKRKRKKERKEERRCLQKRNSQGILNDMHSATRLWSGMWGARNAGHTAKKTRYATDHDTASSTENTRIQIGG